MSFLRFLLLLSLAIWIGALIFFPVVAQTAFSSLPSPHIAGLLVRGALIKLHWIGFIGGLVFLACSLIYNRVALGRTRIFATSHLLLVLMLGLTAISQFGIIPRMDVLRISVGDISLLAADNPLRVQFDLLHAWSVRIEQAVLILGLFLLYSVARRFSSPQA